MRKLYRPLAYLGTVAMIASSMSFPAVAATTGGWELRGNDWYYVKNGEEVRDEWRTSGEHKYYLGEDGRMMKNALIEDGDKVYYVKSDGSMLTNQWRLLEVDGDYDDRWYYFDNNGRAYEEGWKTINGRKYHFSDHKMDYGWLDADGNMLSEDGYSDDNDWAEATYYCGDNTTGWRYEDSWIRVDDFDTDRYPDNDCIWVWMESGGKKAVDKTKSIKNKRYSFNEEGAMVTEWYGSATPSEADYKYYDNPDGDRTDGEWFQAVPSEEQNATDHDNDTLRWFYANKSGVTYKGSIKTIKNKKYVFDENGIMQTGFVVVSGTTYVRTIGGYDEEGNVESMPSPAELAAVDDGTIMFFGPDGARKTGKFKLDLADEDHYVKFNKNGEAAHGVVDGCLYDHGVLIDSGDEKYAIVTVDGKDYLVNKSGKVQKSGKVTDSSNNIEYTVSGNNTDGYTITTAYKD